MADVTNLPPATSAHHCWVPNACSRRLGAGQVPPCLCCFGKCHLAVSPRLVDVGQRWLHLPGQGLSWRSSRWSQLMFGMVTVAFQSRGTSLSPSCPNNLTRGLRSPEAVKPHCCGHVLCGLLVLGEIVTHRPFLSLEEQGRTLVLQ